MQFQFHLPIDLLGLIMLKLHLVIGAHAHTHTLCKRKPTVEKSLYLPVLEQILVCPSQEEIAMHLLSRDSLEYIKICS